MMKRLICANRKVKSMENERRGSGRESRLRDDGWNAKKQMNFEFCEIFKSISFLF